MRVRVRVRAGDEGQGKGKGENCCGNSNLDFHPNFLPPKIVFFILYISLNFTIRMSWTWRGLKTIHLPFLRETECQMYSFLVSKCNISERLSAYVL